MNIILFEPEELSGDKLELTDRRARHIINILAAQPGDQLKVGRINGPTGRGTITKTTKNRVTLKISLDSTPPAQAVTDLILALPRPIMLKRILAQSAALGVDNIYLINSRRVEKSFFSASLLSRENIREYLLSGLEQATATRLPQVSIHPRFRPFVEDVVPIVSRACPVRLAAHPATTNLLPQVTPIPLRDKVLLAIGPEGGWLDYEIVKLREHGFKPFSMGARILRVETAVVALLAQLDLLRSVA